jgi:hypothetical protein
MRTESYPRNLSHNLLRATIAFIVEKQKDDGSIPWFEDGVVDPWTHIENAMAIDVGGYHEEAQKAYEWLAETQLDDGSWYASYESGRPKDTSKVSHVVSYIAVGVWHHFLTTRDKAFLKTMWPTVRAAIDFVLQMRGSNGEIYWARDSKDTIYPEALVTSCSSIYLSLKSALCISSVVEEDKTTWKQAATELARAISTMPCPFSSSRGGSSCFAMDWYYPVMCSVVNGDDARKRLQQGWDKFVVEGFGSLCSLEQNWVTAAETSELALALAVHGDYQRATMVFNWLQQLRDSDGAYWYGIALPQRAIWPEEKPTWTSAAVVLAADMFQHMSPTSLLLDHHRPVAP